MDSVSTVRQFLSNPPADFALLGLPCGEIRIFSGPFESFSEPVAGQNSIYFNDFQLSDSRPYLKSARVDSLTTSERKALAKNPEFRAPKIDWSGYPQSEFMESYLYFRRLLEKNEIIKAVPIGFAYGKLPASELESSQLGWLLEKLIIGQDGLYSYAIRYKDSLVLGATPEILFEYNSSLRIMTSEAVAGSIIKAHAPLSAITGKLKEEHQLVVDDLQQQLASLGNVRTGEVSLKSLPTLCHLRTTLELDLQKAPDISQTIALLHPSGALGVLPRVDLDHPHIKALDLSCSRRSFGAPFGAVFADGSALLLVAIRNLEICADRIRIAAGAGITRQSESDSEFEEVLAKQNSVRQFFGIA